MTDVFSVSSLEEYIKIVERFSPNFSLSRGQGSDLPLFPSALRRDQDGMRLYSKTTIQSFLEDFKFNSQMYIEGASTYHENDWLIHAQHFGVPTCLLDFTYSHLVSLMFALEKAFDYDQDDEDNAVVWLLDPEALNLKTIGRKEIINLSEEAIDSVRRFEHPFIVNSRKNNARMMAQNGLFVYFQYDANALQETDGADKFLKKIEIPHIKTKDMLKALYILGMRFSSIYPELSSISKDIILKNRVLESYKQEENDDGY